MIAPNIRRSGSVWTDKNSDRAAALWKQGRSASTIAAELNVARGAVMGRLARLGLLRTQRELPPPASKPATKPTPPTKPKPEPLWLALVDLDPGMCRYPRDTPEGVKFCALPTGGPKAVWCAGHASLCLVSRPSGTVFKLPPIGSRAVR
jgi:hypothetical protein